MRAQTPTHGKKGEFCENQHFVAAAQESAAAILLVAGLGLVADREQRIRDSHENVTLRVNLFGDFGYHDLYKQFEKAHPGVTIKEDIEDYATHHTNLAKHLATGAGADDVEAIEVGFIAQFKSSRSTSST